MKRIALVFASMLLVAGIANAQTKTPEVAKKATEAALKAASNPKKATKVATWLKLGNAYLDSYNAPMGSGWIGASKQDLALIMGTVKPVSSENVNLGGLSYVKEAYEGCNYYFNENGILAMIEVTKPVYDNALEQALTCFNHASEVDPKGSKTKDLVAGIQSVNTKYMDEAMLAYSLGDFAKSSVKFEKAADALAVAPCSQIDTVAIYNAAYTAWAAGDNDRAKIFFEKCYDLGYYYDDGEVFAKLADIYQKEGDGEKQVNILEEGFTNFPSSQSILIGLINYYIETGGNTSRLFELLGEAKKNEPTNASLYYVEGNIHKQLGEMEEAVNSYMEASQINPEYEFGYIGAGILYYEQAIEVSQKASEEFDDNKYMKLVEEFEQDLKNAIEPFETAFNVTKNDDLKVNIAEYLKNIYYRFYDKGEEYEAGYNKYNKIVKEGL